MRLDAVTVELRPRSGWEAMELGSALVRRHAAAIWLPWFAVTLPVFVAVLLICRALDGLALVPVFMWWLRPVFDRVPLFVLSRAVFGSVPSAGQTLRAQGRWGWRPMLGHLLWRRLSPLRAATLPVDLLEGMRGESQAQRRSVLISGIGGQTALLTLVCSNFILLMQVSLLLFGALLFIPTEFMPQVWQVLQGELRWGLPEWLLLLVAVLDYLALALIEPFYVGAGFGLYLNRRTELEAWDLEIAFRRMRQRLLGAAAAPLIALMLCGAGLLGMATPSAAWAAQDAAGSAPILVPMSAVQSNEGSVAAGEDARPETDATDVDGVDTEADAESDPAESGPADNDPDATASKQAASKQAASKQAASKQAASKQAASKQADPDAGLGLDEIFYEDAVAVEGFGKSVERAYANPDLKPKRTNKVWRKKDKPEENSVRSDLGFLKWISQVIGFVVEYALWILAGALLLLLALTAKRWLPWLRLGLTKIEEESPEIAQQPLPPPEALPPDVATAARRLWAAGEPRRALALLYRASVASMVERTGAVLPPGATESQCMRAARGLRDEAERGLFQRMVRVWEYAAYGHRMPDGDSFEQLVDQLAQRFGWSA